MENHQYLENGDVIIGSGQYRATQKENFFEIEKVNNENETLESYSAKFYFQKGEAIIKNNGEKFEIGVYNDIEEVMERLEMLHNNILEEGQVINRNEVNSDITMAETEKQVQQLCREGKNSNEVAAEMLLKDYPQGDIINALMKHAPNMPDRSDEARKAAQKIVRSAEREITNHVRKIRSTEISR